MSALPSVLHIWNLTGGSSLIDRYYKKLYGGTGTVIARKDFDTFGFTRYYGGTAYGGGAATFTLRAVLKSYRYDIVQVHAVDRYVPLMKRVHPLGKPVVLQYHGHDVLGRWEEKRPRWSKADYLTYSTPDMAPGAPESAHYVRDMVDTEFFRPAGVERVSNSAFTFSYNMDDEARAVASKMGLQLTIFKRLSIPMDEMPKVFSSHEFFFDMRKRTGEDEPVKCIGTGAFQALACGCKVVDWEGKVHHEFPPEHSPEKVMDGWVRVYRELAGS
ncbi:MAG TPA: hypothetical protein VEB67_03295 [Nitrososphaerales archaeon]|nr:hypothetical protein [Nitrososphaerales archaeon]